MSKFGQWVGLWEDIEIGMMNWAFVLVVCTMSAYYLNWITYALATQNDGSVGAVLRLSTQWYGIPALAVVQFLIWMVMPRLFRLCLSPWTAALVWMLLSVCCRVVILWSIRAPSHGDWFAIGGMFVALIGSILWR